MSDHQIFPNPAGGGGGGSASLTLEDLTDVTITGPTVGQVVMWTGSAWVNVTPLLGADLADVIINPSTLDAGDVLEFNGTDWVNVDPTLSMLSDVTLTSLTSGQFLEWNGSAWVNHTLAESDITNLVSDLSTLSSAITAEASARASADALLQLLSGKDVANGYAGLDASALLKTAEFPALTGDVTSSAGGVVTTIAKLQGNVVTASAPADGQALVWVAGDNAWEPISLSSSGGGIPIQNSVSKVTGSLAVNAAETGTLSLGTVPKVGLMYKVVVNHAARVRLYSTAAARDVTAEVNRPNTIPPTPGTSHGVLADLYLDGINAALTWIMSPAATIFNGDSPQNKQVYYRITNIGTSTTAITATFTFDPTQQ
jgi:hypothetical protein